MEKYCIVETEEYGLRINKIINNNIVLPYSSNMMFPEGIENKDSLKRKINDTFGVKNIKGGN